MEHCGRTGLQGIGDLDGDTDRNPILTPLLILFTGGADLESLHTSDMMGRFLYINLNGSNDDRDMAEIYNGESIIFLTACNGKGIITEDYFEKLLSLRARLWVLAGECEISGKEDFYFHKKLLSSGRFLVEDLDMESAAIINRNGFIIALPLRFTGVSGSPCRVLVIQE